MSILKMFTDILVHMRAVEARGARLTGVRLPPFVGNGQALSPEPASFGTPTFTKLPTSGSRQAAEMSSLRDGKLVHHHFVFHVPSHALAPRYLEARWIYQNSATYILLSSLHVTMKFYESNYDYNYAFPAVTLAYFLRYPNPYSKHVLSTDVLERYVDPETNRLHTLRLHLKKSKVPAGILKFLPRGLAGPGGASQSFVLEKSVIDAKEGWMETESRNLEWTGILSVIEKQSYRSLMSNDTDAASISSFDQKKKDWTHCKTVVTFTSRLGQSRSLAQRKTDASAEDDTPKQGFFAAWSTAGIQRTVELLGVKRTKTALVNGKEGMNVVLERLRNGGIVGVLEGMRRDRLEMMGMEPGPWKQVWRQGQNNHDRDDYD